MIDSINRRRNAFSTAEREFILSLRIQGVRPAEITQLANEKFSTTRKVCDINSALYRWKKVGVTANKRISPVRTSFDKPESVSQAIKQLDIIKDMLQNLGSYLSGIEEMEIKSLKIKTAYSHLQNMIQ